jgi:hypothetical protein
MMLAVASAFVGLKSRADSLVISNLYRISREAGRSALSLQESFQLPAFILSILCIVLSIAIAKMKLAPKWLSYLNIIFNVIFLLFGLV